jgi:hypothetical protein
MLTAQLSQKNLLSCPVWYLAKDFTEREVVEIFSDASGDIGGGYVIPGHTFGQFRWSVSEKKLFGANESSTDINAMEFVTAVCAIVANRHLLQGKLVCLHCDNTSAVTWANKLRTSQDAGQGWIRILISVLLTHDILLTSVHIPGVLNVYADALSRYSQHEATASLVANLESMPMLSAESRQMIWSASFAPHSPVEYLLQLRDLETQDCTRSLEFATPWVGVHRTSQGATVIA